MPRKVILLTVSLCLLLGGCGLYRWKKPGSTDAEFNADSTSCQQQGGGDQGYSSCMQSHGWTLVD